MLAEMTKDGMSHSTRQAANSSSEFRPTSLIGRLATVEEVANMVVYACSPPSLRHVRRRACGVEGGRAPVDRLTQPRCSAASPATR